jgi:rod shape-determining protein MreD
LFMKFALLIAITYAVFVLHVAFARELAVGGAMPHIIAAGLAVFATRLPRWHALGLAVLWGLLADGLSGDRFGPHLAVFVVLVQALRVSARRPTGVRPWVAAVLTAPGAGCALAASHLANRMGDLNGAALATIVTHAAGSGVYTAIMVAAFGAIGRWFFHVSRDAVSPEVPTLAHPWWLLTE